MKRKAWIFGRIVITTVLQADGAPIIDQCAGRLADARRWKGRALHLAPWRRDRYGERQRGLALCIGVMDHGTYHTH